MLHTKHIERGATATSRAARLRDASASSAARPPPVQPLPPQPAVVTVAAVAAVKTPRALLTYPFVIAEMAATKTEHEAQIAAAASASAAVERLAALRADRVVLGKTALCSSYGFRSETIP